MKQLKKTALILLLAIGVTLGMVPLAAAPVHAADYDLWVGEKQVTDENKDNIPVSSGTASYDPDTKTLTLNEASINDTHGFEFNNGGN